MREQILHFIWEHQYFKIGKASTLDGLPIKVINAGHINVNAGPDFEQAKLFIGDVEWNGDVEIHIKSSDWSTHSHQLDKAYNKVVLHVVWVNDKPVYREDGTIMPTLELKYLVDEEVLKKAEILLNTLASIPCYTQLHGVPEIIITNEIERAFIKRLERKAKVVMDILSTTKGDWQEVTYRFFMRQMGMKVNGEAFNELAVIIPYSLVKKYSDSVFKIESLFFGASGLLKTKTKDSYMLKLEKEYNFLAHKHKLTRELNPELWKLLRLRPANFPTLRLAQSVAMLAKNTSLFSLFTECPETINTSNFKVSEYWKTHYTFNVKAAKSVPAFGKASLDLLLINVVAPLLAAFSKSIDKPVYITKALDLLSSIKPENNKIIRTWKELNIEPINAGQTQGLIELYNESCLAKKCLSCGIGFNIIKQ